MVKVLGPYLILHFFILPLPVLFIPSFLLTKVGYVTLNSTTLWGHPAVLAYFTSVGTLILADLLSNIHSFIVITTNHAGKDLYKFNSGCLPQSSTFFLRQVISSANFRTGGDINDFFHGWLNYQIEHHVWPNLSALSYQKGQSKLKKICEKYCVPYVQESVWIRLWKTLEIMVGKTSMREFPDDMQIAKDMKIWSNVDIRKVSTDLGQGTPEISGSKV